MHQFVEIKPKYIKNVNFRQKKRKYIFGLIRMHIEFTHENT